MVRQSWGRDAKDGRLGISLLYYALVHALPARTAVCLGSGGGFVPPMMRQAQRDLGLAEESRTILIDGNVPEGGWGSPTWLHSRSFFRRSFADVEIVLERTVDAAARLSAEGMVIDYLNIDADCRVLCRMPGGLPGLPPAPAPGQRRHPPRQLLPDRGGTPSERSWRHVEAEAFLSRNVLAAHFVRNCSTVIEVGGAVHPIDEFLTGEHQAVITVEPLAAEGQCDHLNRFASPGSPSAGCFQDFAWQVSPGSTGW